MNGNIAIYTKTQLNATSQNGRPNFCKSLHLNLSSSVNSRFVLPSFLSAYESIITRTIPAIREIMQIPVPSIITVLINPSSLFMSRGSATPPKTEESLEIVRLRPRAKPSSLPLNHCDIIADYDTDIHSPPNPNITLPASMIQ